LKKLILYSLFVFLPWFLLAQGININGVYRGKDVFVQNPYTNMEGAFCIDYIIVNGKTVIEQPVTSAVKVDLSGFEIDAPVSIEVYHHTGCLPKILNPEVLDEGSSFEFIQITVDNASISWVTTGEMPGQGLYLIEKLKLDGWEPIDTIRGKGNLDNNQYSIGVDHYAGDNKFKIIYRYQDERVESDEFEFYSDLDPISIYPENNVYDLISLSRPTDWVIKSYDGDLLLKGYGQDINVESLPYGEFILVIENTENNFFRPEPEVIDRPKKKKSKKKANR